MSLQSYVNSQNFWSPRTNAIYLSCFYIVLTPPTRYKGFTPEEAITNICAILNLQELQGA